MVCLFSLYPAGHAGSSPDCPQIQAPLPADFHEAVISAKALSDKGMFSAAAQSLAAFAKAHPSTSFAYVDYNIGFFYHQAKEFKKAIPYLKKTVEQAPCFLEGHRLLAKALYDIGDVEAAPLVTPVVEKAAAMAKDPYQVFLEALLWTEAESPKKALPFLEQLETYDVPRFERLAALSKAKNDLQKQISNVEQSFMKHRSTVDQKMKSYDQLLTLPYVTKSIEKSIMSLHKQLAMMTAEMATIQQNYDSLSEFKNNTFKLVDQINNQIRIINSKLKDMLEIEEKINIVTTSVHNQSEHIVGLGNEISNISETTQKELTFLKNRYMWLLFFGSIFFILFLATTGIFLYLLKKQKTFDALDDKIALIGNNQREEQQRVQEQVAELFQANIEIINQINELTDIKSVEEDDHTLELSVGNEIFRMRKRLKNIPEDIIGFKAIKKALDRLEDDFNAKGYEIVDMLNQPFYDGLTASVNYVTSKEIPRGEQKISRVVKPQINFNNVLIQMSDIEVTKGE